MTNFTVLLVFSMLGLALGDGLNWHQESGRKALRPRSAEEIIYLKPEAILARLKKIIPVQKDVVKEGYLKTLKHTNADVGMVIETEPYLGRLPSRITLSGVNEYGVLGTDNHTAFCHLEAESEKRLKYMMTERRSPSTEGITIFTIETIDSRLGDSELWGTPLFGFNTIRHDRTVCKFELNERGELLSLVRQRSDDSLKPFRFQWGKVQRLEVSVVGTVTFKQDQ